MATNPAASYKARKEAFVSDLSGSSLTDINLVTLVAPSAILLWAALQKTQALFTPYTLAAGVVDFLVNVTAVLFSITLYSSVPLVLNIFLVTPAALLFLLAGSAGQSRQDSSTAKVKQRKPSSKATASTDKGDVSQSPRLPVRPFLTHYRGSMLVTTCLAILAVDFPIFPRRFAKVETWGTSLMDIGVGSFVFSAGVVSARGFLKTSQLQASAGASSAGTSTFSTRFARSIRHSIPLLVLGFIRLWSVKGLDYAEHVTEYGVHWNFFFTLGFIPPFAEVSDSITRRVFKRYEILALVVAGTYEIVLNNTDLLGYILVSPRGPDLLSKNREGVFSFIGYLAIFLAGRGTGASVMRFQDAEETPANKNQDAMTRTKRERATIQRKLAIQSAIHGSLFLLATSVFAFNLNVSRRLANLPYVLWIVTFNNAQMLLCAVVEGLGPAFSYAPEDAGALHSATSVILRAYNGNGLAVFLVANLLTGLVNLTVNTLDMSNIAAMGVLIAYAALVTAFALVLHFSGVKIKL